MSEDKLQCAICGEQFDLDVFIVELQNHFLVKHKLNLTSLRDIAKNLGEK